MKKFLKKFIDILCILVGIHGSDSEKEAINGGAVDFSGQGRDKYGR